MNEPESVPAAGGAAHVYAAIAAVTGKLAKEGISKSRKNDQQGYRFRGIDDVYNALSPVLAEQKLCPLPRVLNRTVTERQTQRGGVLFYVVVEVAFDLVSAVDGSKHTVVVIGEAMDSGDKATNKAMSAAYKYMAIQVFCIPTEGDNDADATTHEVAPRPDLSPHPDTSDVPATTASKYADAFKEALTSGVEGRVMEVHHDLQGEGDTVYSAAWKLLDAPTRRAIKDMIARARAAA